MPSNPSKHRRYNSIRRPGWDYTTPGFYFVTICTHRRDHLFENTPFREVAEQVWRAIPIHAPHILLDEWIVMPNHVHGILVMAEPPRMIGPRKQDKSEGQARHVQPGSIGASVGNFKSVVARRINVLRRTPGEKVWERGYYDRVVRDEQELNAIRHYIRENPIRWAEDQENLETLVARMRLVVPERGEVTWHR